MRPLKLELPLGDLCCGLGCDVIAASAHQWLIPKAPTHVGLVESSPPMSSSTSEPGAHESSPSGWNPRRISLSQPEDRNRGQLGAKPSLPLALPSRLFFMILFIYCRPSCKTFLHRIHPLAPGGGAYMGGDSFQLVNERRYRCHCLRQPRPLDALFTLKSRSSSRIRVLRVGRHTRTRPDPPVLASVLIRTRRRWRRLPMGQKVLQTVIQGYSSISKADRAQHSMRA